MMKLANRSVYLIIGHIAHIVDWELTSLAISSSTQVLEYTDSTSKQDISVVT